MLSLCMIVKNEEHSLPQCLDSVRSLSPELIIVDTGSTDATIPIAQQHGAHVSSFDFKKVDFAAARNHSLSRARGRWILVLDADETLEQSSLPLLKSILESDENAGYFLQRVNHSSNSSASTTDHVVRLFPNRTNHRYRGRVHEIIDKSILSGDGKLIESSIRIDHKLLFDREARHRKNYWYIDILKEEIAADPGDDSRLDFLAAEYHQLEMFNEAADIAEHLARLRPLDPQAHLFAGAYHLLFKTDRVQARVDFNRALNLRPDYPEAKSFLCLLDRAEDLPITPSKPRN
jgi:glycosyltransferase involved in cell wall biosynthesis